MVFLLNLFRKYYPNVIIRLNKTFRLMNSIGHTQGYEFNWIWMGDKSLHFYLKKVKGDKRRTIKNDGIYYDK